MGHSARHGTVRSVGLLATIHRTRRPQPSLGRSARLWGARRGSESRSSRDVPSDSSTSTMSVTASVGSIAAASIALEEALDDARSMDDEGVEDKTMLQS